MASWMVYSLSARSTLAKSFWYPDKTLLLSSASAGYRFSFFFRDIVFLQCLHGVKVARQGYPLPDMELVMQFLVLRACLPLVGMQRHGPGTV